MILVIGRVLIREGSISQALQLSLEHVARSRTEPGCVSHSVHQDAENSMCLVFVEEWADQAALQQHFKVAESRVFAKELSALAAEPPSMVIYNATAVGQ